MDVVRFETVADLEDDRPPGGMAVSAQMDAILTDGTRVVILDDRGFQGGPTPGALRPRKAPPPP